jgi:hypothetical protein
MYRVLVEDAILFDLQVGGGVNDYRQSGYSSVYPNQLLLDLGSNFWIAPDSNPS